MRRYLPVIYLAINAVCAVLVFYAAHRVTAQMAMEHRTTSDSVDGITFFVTAVPGLAIAVLANAAWIAKVLADLWRRRGSGALLWLGAAMIVWGAAILAARLDPG